MKNLLLILIFAVGAQAAQAPFLGPIQIARQSDLTTVSNALVLTIANLTTVSNLAVAGGGGGGSGTVTSVAISVPSLLSVSGSPITSSGTLALSYSGTALPIANGGTAATSASGARAALGLVIGTDVQGYSVNLAGWSVLAPSSKQDQSANLDAWSLVATSAKADTSHAHAAADVTSGTLAKARGGTGADNSSVTFPSSGIVAVYGGQTNTVTFALSDMTTALTTGTNKNYWYAPAAGMTIKAVRATLATASSSGLPTVDINEAGTTILSTKITIDANEWESRTAAAAAVISDSAIAGNAKVDFDIDVAGTAAAGLQVQIDYTTP